jgi:hypothetical protein
MRSSYLQSRVVMITTRPVGVGVSPEKFGDYYRRYLWKIPLTDRVTTDVRWMVLYSGRIIAKAIRY